jgi:hypothetical protein
MHKLRCSVEYYQIQTDELLSMVDRLASRWSDCKKGEMASVLEFRLDLGFGVTPRVLREAGHA